jgi:hypothetical protein
MARGFLTALGIRVGLWLIVIFARTFVRLLEQISTLLNAIYFNGAQVCFRTRQFFSLLF